MDVATGTTDLNKTGTDDRNGALTLPMMAAWGIGSLGPAMVMNATNALLLRFMTDFYGIAAGFAAILIAIAKFYDVFADMAMGVISDHTRSRWGRRRPFLIAGSILLGLSVVAIFAAPAFPSQSLRVCYMVVMLLFYASAYSVFSIPYLAMAGEMTRHYHERTELMRWRVYGIGLAMLVAVFVGPMILQAFGGGAFSYAIMGVIFAPICVATGLMTFWGTAKAPVVAYTSTHHSIRQQIMLVVSNRPFMILLSVKLIILLLQGTQAIFAYFFERILGASNGVLGIYFLVQSVAMLASPSLWLWVSRRYGKKATFLTALALGVPTYLSWLLAHHGEPATFIYMRALLTGAGMSGIILIGQSMLPDVMEYDFRRTGLRREGVFAALYTLVEKLAAAIGVAIVGAMLAAYGYVQSRGIAIDQPDGALWAIRMIMSVMQAGINLACIIVLIGYRLDERDLAETAPGR